MNVLPIALAGAAAVGLYLVGKKMLGTSAPPGSGNPNQPAGTVNTLDQGKVYAVVVSHQASGGADPAVGSAHVASYFTSMGFQIMSPPTLRNGEEQAKFAGGQPAAWQFLARWTKPEKYVTNAPADPSMGLAMFTPAPVS